ncbi:MAG: glycosyltransferase family 4 protein [Planctomycetes bacterium]|nr:glycosyltransferase family 4 protein [Planctomycetota bacterium]
MKVLVLYDYPPAPGGLATQGDLLYRGLREIGVDAHPAHYESPQEKEWYYRWLAPDVVVGVGYWGHAPHIILHPQRFGVRAVPWVVADGYVANYQEVFNKLPLILATSNWVRDVYKRDGLDVSNFKILPVGCDTDAFVPRDRDDPKVRTIRESLGIAPDEIMILTVGGDAASKGGQEVMQALAMIDHKAPDWKYVCKVWPQVRTEHQNLADMQLAAQLGIDKKVIFATSRISRGFMPYLMAACDIYAAPSRLEGFGMIQVEANACGKPVIGIKAMGLLDTMVHGETAFLADVAQEIRARETIVGADQGYKEGHRVIFKRPRTVDFRASIHDIANYLMDLMTDAALRKTMGEAGRKRVVELFDYRAVARQFVDITTRTLGRRKRSNGTQRQRPGRTGETRGD